MTLESALAAGVLVTDGALGTLGFARGLTGSTASWVLDRPDEVVALHRAYVDSGAQLVVTNTFGASRAWLPDDLDVGAVNRAAVALARRAVAGAALVAGDIGPTGLGASDGAAVAGIVREQAAALVEAGVDVLLLETYSSLDELRTALEAVNDVRAAVPVLASMTFQGDVRPSPTALAELAERFSLAAVGANCSEGPDSLLPVVAKLVDATRLPVIARPSAGLPIVEDGEARYPLSTEAVAEGIVRLADAGARIVGGCCGTDPAVIQSLVRAVRTTERFR